MMKSKKFALGTFAFLAIVCVFAGIISLTQTFAVKANAESGVSATPSDLFTADSGMTKTTVDDMTGLAVNTATNTATFNGTLSGDFETEYIYASQKWGAVEFGFYDADNPDELVFSVFRKWGLGNAGQAAIIDYTSGERKVRMLNSDITSADLTGIYTLYNTGWISLPDEDFEIVPSPHSYKTPGKIILKWNGDNVTIKLLQRNGSDINEVEMATLFVPNFKDGYVMKVFNSTNMAASQQMEVVVLSMNGVSLGTDSLNATVKENTGKIAYDGEYDENGTATIDLLQGKELKQFKYCDFGCVIDQTASGYGKLEFTAALGHGFTHADSFANKAVGKYNLTAEYNGISKAYAVNVKKSAKVNPIDLFTADSNVTAKEVDGMKGVAVNTVNDNATVNGTISGDFEMEYIYSQHGWGSTEIGFYRKSDLTKPVFSVYRRYGTDNLGSALVFDNTGTTSRIWANGSFQGTAIEGWILLQTGEASRSIETYPAVCSNENYKLPGKIKLKWKGDAVSIYVTVGWEGQNLQDYLMATLNVPNFKDEYVLKITKPVSFTFGGLGDDSLVMLSMNGESLADTLVANPLNATSIGYDGESVVDGKPVIETTSKTLNGFNVYGDCELEGMKVNGVVDSFEATNVNVPMLGVGEHAITVENGGLTKDYTLKIKGNYNSKTDMVFGASVRLDENLPGLKFTATIADYDEALSYGMLILPKVLFTTYENEFNGGNYIAALNADGKEGKYANKICAPYQTENGEWKIALSLVNIKEQNYAMDFVGIAYVCDGEIVTYAATDIATNARNAAYVAQMALKNQTDLTEQQRANLEKYAASAIVGTKTSIITGINDSALNVNGATKSETEITIGAATEGYDYDDLATNGTLNNVLTNGGYASISVNGEVGTNLNNDTLALVGKISFNVVGDKQFAIVIGNGETLGYLYYDGTSFTLYNGSEKGASITASGELSLAVTAEGRVFAYVGTVSAYLGSINGEVAFKIVGLGGSGSVAFTAIEFEAYNN